MVQKRPFSENESIEISSKQSRHLESEELSVSVLEFPYKSAVQSSHSSGEVDNCAAKMKPEYDEMFGFAIPEPLSCPVKDLGSKGSSPLPLLSRITSSTREEGKRLESSFQMMSSPDYYNTERMPLSHGHHAEIYSFLLDHPPRKAVAVGLDFQADVPECVGHGVDRTFICPKKEPAISFECFDSMKEPPGLCVTPMPETILPVESGDIGFGRGLCTCADMGSMRCDRQHIVEARDKLRRNLGNEAFAQLGFCDMGEVVAEKWSGEEEHLYHEVVFSYPASSGMNFWEHLAAEFASRTKNEIVSYYFNVFMLRKRGEQNRVQSLNIDSDDDEWQGPDDSSDDEIGEDNFMADSDRHVSVNKSCDEFITQMTSFARPSDDLPESDVGDVTVGTSFDKSDDFKHEFMLEACNDREWDVGYTDCPRNEIDLLPTCSMIEEVFGAGSWNCNGRDGHGLS